jgi:hypothetical protein
MFAIQKIYDNKFSVTVLDAAPHYQYLRGAISNNLERQIIHTVLMLGRSFMVYLTMSQLYSDEQWIIISKVQKKSDMA